jgi:hypothetical protein
MNETNAQQPPDTPEGHTRYLAQIAAWNALNGHIAQDALSIWSTGYPISPGTAIPCSGECWKCGAYTSPVHQSGPCPKALVPVLERRYRATCGQWFGRLHMPAPAMNYVDVVEVEGVPWYAAAGSGDGAGDGAGAGFVHGQH